LDRRWKVIFLALLIITVIIQGYNVYAFVNSKPKVWAYKVTPLDYIPDDAWNLTDPDPYILDAIKHPGELSEPFDYRDSMFWYTAPWYEHYDQTLFEKLGRRPKPFLYNGTCYDYDAIPLIDVTEYPFPGHKPEITVITVTLAGAWIIASLAYFMKNKTEV